MIARLRAWSSWEPVGLEPYEAVQARLLDRILRIVLALAAVSGVYLVALPETRFLAPLPLVASLPFLFAQRALRQGRLWAAARIFVWTLFVAYTSPSLAVGGIVGSGPMYMQAGVMVAVIWLPGVEAWLVALAYAAVLGALYLWPDASWGHETPHQVALALSQLVATVQAGLIVGLVVDALERTSGESEARAAAARAAKDEALAALQSKTAFLATMSHELRTPLNAIIGYAGLLREDGGDDDGELGRIERSGRQLLGIVEDVLELARAESTAIPPAARFDVRSVVAEVTRRPSGPPDPVWARADAGSVRRILGRLVAAASTDGGTPQVEVAQGPDGPRVTVWHTAQADDDDLALTLAQALASRIGATVEPVRDGVRGEGRALRLPEAA